MEYNPTNWYWIIAGNEARFYSSASGDYVTPTDAAYVAWLAAGGTPSHIASEAELGAVLAPYALRPTATGVLDAYQGAQADGLTAQVVAKALFYLANQVRALQGQQAISAAQFRTVLKGLM